MPRLSQAGNLVFRPDGDGAGEGGGVSAWTPPEDWPENFKTPMDAVNSYKESQAEMNRMRSQMEAERAQFAETIASIEDLRPQPQQTSSRSDDPNLSAWKRAIEDGDLDRAYQIQQESLQNPVVDAVGKLLDERFEKLQPTLDQQTQQQRQTAITMAEDMVAKQLGPETYQALLPDIQKIVAENPHYLPNASSVEGYRDSILAIAKLADYETQKTLADSLQAERAEKLAAQTVTGSGRVANVTTGDAARSEVERIKATQVGSYGELMRG